MILLYPIVDLSQAGDVNIGFIVDLERDPNSWVSIPAQAAPPPNDLSLPATSDSVINDDEPALARDPKRLQPVPQDILLIRINKHEIISPLISRQTLLRAWQPRARERSVRVGKCLHRWSDVDLWEGEKVGVEEVLLGYVGV